MSEGLSRDELIEKVAELIDDQYDDYSPRYNAAGVCVSSGLAAAAVDAVLSAVADEVIGKKQPRWGVTTDYDQGFLDGWDDHQAAVGREVRALLADGGDRE